MRKSFNLREVTKSEEANIKVSRKSVVASKAIKKGECFTEQNITIKRPGTGISSMMWDSILGKIASRDYELDDLL